MNEVTRISGVRGFVDGNGVAQLNADDIARGWGFTRTKDGSEYVMWDRVNRYLQEFGFSTQVRKDDFIPENMAYRLGFKASNEAAQVFQAKLADEILPAIRKHGAYLTNDTIEKVLTDPDTIIKIATQLKDERAKNNILSLKNAQQEQIINEMKPKANYVDDILQNKGLVTITQISKDYGMSGKAMNEKLHELKVQYKQSKQWLLYAQHQTQGYTHSETIQIVRSDGRPDIAMETKWTQKGRLFLYNLLKEHGIVPIIERKAEGETA